MILQNILYLIFYFYNIQVIQCIYLMNYLENVCTFFFWLKRKSSRVLWKYIPKYVTLLLQRFQTYNSKVLTFLISMVFFLKSFYYFCLLFFIFFTLWWCSGSHWRKSSFFFSIFSLLCDCSTYIWLKRNIIISPLFSAII